LLKSRIWVANARKVIPLPGSGSPIDEPFNDVGDVSSRQALRHVGLAMPV